MKRGYPVIRALIFMWGTATALSERVTTLLKAQHHESAEFANVVGAAAWFLPCAFNPHFLQSSVYVQEVGNRLGLSWSLVVFAALFCYWLACLVIGSPEPLVYETGRLRPKTVARLAGF